MSALVFGHSFVARHKTYLDSHTHLRASLNCQFSSVVFRGYGGLAVLDDRMVQLLVHDLQQVRPAYLIIDLGSNDCGKVPRLSEVPAIALELFCRVMSAIERAGSDIPKVVFLEQHKRSVVHRSAVISVTQLNRHIECFNIELGRVTSNRYLTVASVRTSFFRFRRMRLNWLDNLSSDGVHLNDNGNKRYMRNLKGALLMAARL